jgi:long-chain acyl-CoA synthetase
MLGYWNNEAESAKVLKGGWLKTGDMATVDSDGFFTIVDRKKDMILVSGFNVYPNEIEEKIAQLEGVQEVGVIGIPDEKSGERVKAYIVAGTPAPTAEQVIAHCREDLAAYKVPTAIEFVDELPKSPIGKILRRELRAQVIAASDAKKGK